MARNRRDQRQSATDIWPGFVDALSTLLLVIIFLLVVFVLGQFFLGRLLEGKDSKLLSLEQAISELNDQLSLEQDTNEKLRLSVAKLTADLQAATADRDENDANLAEISAQRDEYRDQLITLEEDKKLLAETLAELRRDEDRSDDLEADLARANQLRAELEEELEKSKQAIETDQETLEARLAELVQLRRDIEALKETRKNLELDVSEMTALLREAETAKKDAADEIARLTSLLEIAQSEADKLEAQVVELDRTKENSASLEQRVAALTDALNAKENELDQTKEEKTSLEERIAKLTADLDAEKSDLNQANEETVSLEERIAELNAKLTSREDEQEAAEDKLRDLQAELDKLIAERDAERQSRDQALEEAEDELVDRERRIAELAAQLEALRGTRETVDADLEELSRAREALLVELGQARDRASQLEARLASEQERTLLAQQELEDRAIQIAELLRSVGQANEAANTERKLSREAVAQIDVLNSQINNLRLQLASLSRALELEQKRVEEQKVTIADLGSKLNVALAGKVEELSKFRSEFFGRLRQILGTRSDVRVVGDRFVFQSEILFPSGEATLEESGEDELRALARSLREISAEIPSDLPWVLQIDGHTDRRRISTDEFPSNWELSTARATTVGKFLIRAGIPEERIAVAGFAQYQPLDRGSSEGAFRNNRRIEIKLTTR
ncbi:MAG: peptidoglycan -binding protein [Geminicoccaceae bacterium]